MKPIMFKATSKKFTLAYVEDGVNTDYEEERTWLEERYSYVDDLEITEIYTKDYLLRNVPEPFKSKFSYMAYQRGHWAGDHEIMLHVQEYVSELLPCIDEYRRQIMKECGK